MPITPEEDLLREANAQKVLPPKDTGGPVAQLKRNLTVYAQVYTECMKHADQVLKDSVEGGGVGGEGGMELTERLDRQTEIANVLFEQFWNDQIAIKKNSPIEKAMELAKTYLEEKGQMGLGMGIGMMGNYMGG